MILDMWMLLELFESKVLVEIWNANNIHMGPPCVCMRDHGYGRTQPTANPSGNTTCTQGYYEEPM